VLSGHSDDCRSAGDCNEGPDLPAELHLDEAMQLSAAAADSG
jgi:hypothetical protein